MNNRVAVLVVDDEEPFRTVICDELQDIGFDVAAVASGGEAKEYIIANAYDVVLLDLKLGDIDGIEVLKIIKELTPTTEVIMLTAYGTIDNAVKAIKLGAYDYLTKPCSLEELEVVIQKAYEKKSLRMQNAALKQELAKRHQYDEFIGQSSGLKTVLATIGKVSQRDTTVLIYGESGTGKELVARAIHRNSQRKKEPFVVIDCTALQESLLESELFGHERGAYTNAVGLKYGLFEVADKGTIFMDEIGELTPGIQVKLLRALETQTFRRVGGTKDLHVDVRLIVATNKNLRQLISEGKFREDLFYRLDVVSILIPPLRERKEDTPLLAQHFLAQSIRGQEEKTISQEVMDMLVEYNWPGNIRELQNVIERAVVFSESSVITPKDLPNSLRVMRELEFGKEGSFLSLEEIANRYIASVLQYVGGHREKASQILGISERHLYRKLQDSKIKKYYSDS